MGKNSGQRIKGNLKPANSQRAADILSASGYLKPTFIGFQNTNQTDPFQKLTSINVNSDIDSNLEIAFKRIAKKDITTRIKALNDILHEVKKLTCENQKPVLLLWTQFFPLLVFNENVTIKELASKITLEFYMTHLDQLIDKNIGTIISYLFISSFDPNLPKAKCFDTLFPSHFEKIKILSNVQTSLTGVFVNNFKGINQLKKDEIDKNLFISTNILAIKDIILLFESKKQLEEKDFTFSFTNYELILTTFMEQDHQIISNPSNNDIITAAYFALVQTSLMHLSSKTIFNSSNPQKIEESWNFYILNKVFQTLPQLSNNNISYSENMIKNVWESVTACLMKYKEYEKYIQLEAIVIPAILTFLGPDNPNPFTHLSEKTISKECHLVFKSRFELYVIHVYPTLLPLLHLIVTQVGRNRIDGDGHGVTTIVEKFIQDFFLHFYNGSFKIVKKLSNLLQAKCYATLFKTHMECLLYTFDYFLNHIVIKIEDRPEQLIIAERIKDQWYDQFLECEISYYGNCAGVESALGESIFKVMLTGLYQFTVSVSKEKLQANPFYSSLLDDALRRLHSLMFGRLELINLWLDQLLETEPSGAERVRSLLLSLMSEVYATLCEAWTLGKLSTLCRLCESAVKTCRYQLPIDHFSAGRLDQLLNHDDHLSHFIATLLNRRDSSPSQNVTANDENDHGVVYDCVCKILMTLQYPAAPYDPLQIILRTDSELFIEFLKLKLSASKAPLSADHDLFNLVNKEFRQLIATQEFSSVTTFPLKLLEVCLCYYDPVWWKNSQDGVATFFVDVPNCFVTIYQNQLATINSLKFVTELRRSILMLYDRACSFVINKKLEKNQIMTTEFVAMLDALKSTEFDAKFHACLVARNDILQEENEYGMKEFRKDFVGDWARTIHLSSSFVVDDDQTCDLLHYFHIKNVGPFVTELVFSLDTPTTAYIPLMTNLMQVLMKNFKDKSLELDFFIPRHSKCLDKFKDKLGRCKWNVVRAINGCGPFGELVDWSADEIDLRDFLPFQTGIYILRIGQVISFKAHLEVGGKELIDILAILNEYGGHFERCRTSSDSGDLADRVLWSLLDRVKGLDEFMETVKEFTTLYAQLEPSLGKEPERELNGEDTKELTQAFGDITLGLNDHDGLPPHFDEMTALLNRFATICPDPASFKSVIYQLRRPAVSECMSRRLYDTEAVCDVERVHFVATVLKMFRTFVTVLSHLPHPDLEGHCEDLEFMLCTMVVYVPDCLQILRDLTMASPIGPIPMAPQLKVMCFHWLNLLSRVTVLMTGIPNALPECYGLYRMKKEFLEFFADALHLPLYQTFNEALSNPSGTLAFDYESGKVPYLVALVCVAFCDAASLVSPLSIVLRVESTMDQKAKSATASDWSGDLDSVKSVVARLLPTLDRANTPLATTAFLLLTRLLKVYGKELTYSLYKETNSSITDNNPEVPQDLPSETGAVNYIIDATREAILKIPARFDQDCDLSLDNRTGMLEFCYKSILTIESAAVLDPLLKMEVFQTPLHKPQKQCPPSEVDDLTLIDAICMVFLNQFMLVTQFDKGNKNYEEGLKAWWNKVGLEYCQRMYARREDFSNKVDKNESQSIIESCDPLSNFGATQIFRDQVRGTEHLQLILAYFILRECPTKARRMWILNGSKARVKWLKDVFCGKYGICQAIVDQEFRAIQAHFERDHSIRDGIAVQRPNATTPKSNEFEVKVKRKVGEITARYVAEDFCLEIEIKLPTDYPLSPCTIKCTKKSGVSQTQWRTWLLQLNALIVYRDGTLLDGLKLWKRNVDRYLDGAASCMICFSIIDPKDYSLTKNTCPQCKNKYHSTCLYKWFSTSHNTTCPLCRNRF